MTKLWNKITPSLGVCSMDIENNTLSKGGISDIRAILEKHHLSIDFPKYDWQWVWQVDEGTYKGNLPTRIANYAYKRYNGFKLPEEVKREIGDSASKNVGLISGGIEFDFDEKLDWDSGKFGDSGSCFWQSRRDCIKLLRHKGARAIRFYKDGKGIGRAWLANAELGILVFNAYGIPLFEIARILTLFIGLDTKGVTSKQIALSCRGSTEHPLYINGGVCFLVGEKQEVNSFDLKWREETLCNNCETFIPEDYNGGGLRYKLCARCWNSMYKKCCSCGKMIARGENNGDLCLSCAAYLCVNCGKYEAPRSQYRWDRLCARCQSAEDAFLKKDVSREFRPI